MKDIEGFPRKTVETKSYYSIRENDCTLTFSNFDEVQATINNELRIFKGEVDSDDEELGGTVFYSLDCDGVVHAQRLHMEPERDSLYALRHQTHLEDQLKVDRRNNLEYQEYLRLHEIYKTKTGLS
jgi:hypothetical protein